MPLERGQYVLIFISTIHFAYFIVEKYFSILTKSLALEIDSYRVLADGISMLISVIVMLVAQKGNEKHSYGYGRGVVLGGFADSTFILAFSLSLISHTVSRLIKTEELKHPITIVIMGGVGLFINLTYLTILAVLMALEKRANEKQKVKEDESGCDFSSLTYSKNSPAVKLSDEKFVTNRIETKKQHIDLYLLMIHVIGNNLASLGLILSGLLSKLGEGQWCHYADPLITICIISFIIVTNFPLLYRTSHIMLQTIPNNIKTDDIIEQIKKTVPGVLNVHEFHIWQLSDNTVVSTLHYVVTSYHFLNSLNQIKLLLMKIGIEHISIQPEICTMGEYDETVQECLLKRICDNGDCSKMQCCNFTPSDKECHAHVIKISYSEPKNLSE
ncbi:cobalt uptake protein COT1-like [Argonauta hians]